MKIDGQVALRQQVFAQAGSDPAGQGARSRTGEAAVYILPIGYIAAEIVEAVDVQQGHDDDTSGGQFVE